MRSLVVILVLLSIVESLDDSDREARKAQNRMAKEERLAKKAAKEAKKSQKIVEKESKKESKKSDSTTIPDFGIARGQSLNASGNTDNVYFGITVESAIPEEIIQEEEESQLSPEERVMHVTNLMEDWISRNAANYFNKAKLSQMVKKIRQQYRGNIEQCRKHPLPETVQQRTLLLQDDNGILDRIIPKELASQSRTMSSRIGGTPLDELDDINLRLTKLVKTQLRKCKRFNHFVHLRDVTMKNFARAFIRVSGYPTYSKQRKEMEGSNMTATMPRMEQYSDTQLGADMDHFVEEDGIIADDFVEYDYYERKLAAKLPQDYVIFSIRDRFTTPSTSVDSDNADQENIKTTSTTTTTAIITTSTTTSSTATSSTTIDSTTTSNTAIPTTSTSFNTTIKTKKVRSTTPRHHTKRQMKERNFNLLDATTTVTETPLPVTNQTHSTATRSGTTEFAQTTVTLKDRE